MVSQIDKLAKDIEDFLDDYDGQLIQKQPIGEEDFKKLQNELVKKLCFYIVKRVNTAVEAERKEIIEMIFEVLGWNKKTNEMRISAPTQAELILQPIIYKIGKRSRV